MNYVQPLELQHVERRAHRGRNARSGGALDLEADTQVASHDEEIEARPRVECPEVDLVRPGAQPARDDAPTMPPTAEQYTAAGLPWFDYYSEGAKALKGSAVLAGLKSVFQFGKEKGETPLPENESITPERVVELRSGLKQDQVREGLF